MRRVKQVLSAIQAEITPQEREFVARSLKPIECELFGRMSVPDQRHCLNVAYTVMKELADDGWRDIDQTAVFKAALLHDIGRQGGDVSTVDKILAVVARTIFGRNILQRWGQPGRGGIWKNLRHAFFVNARHPQIGADMLRSIGSEAAVIQLVLCHHDLPDPADSPELKLLRHADDLN